MKAELWPAAGNFFSLEFLPFDSSLRKHAAQTFQVSVGVIAEPENTGLPENLPSRADGKLLPERQ